MPMGNIIKKLNQLKNAHTQNYCLQLESNSSNWAMPYDGQDTPQLKSEAIFKAQEDTTHTTCRLPWAE